MRLLLAFALFLYASSAFSQTNNQRIVTNWVPAPLTFRTVHGKLYNTLIDPKWKPIVVKVNSRIAELSSESPGPVTITFWPSGEPLDARLTFRNFQYNPADFVDGTTDYTYPRGERYGRGATVKIKTGTRHLARDFSARVMPLVVTNKSIIRTEYDCGLYYTNLIPIAKWEKVRK